MAYVHQHSDGYAENHAGAPAAHPEYKYADFNWASAYGHNPSPNPVKYSYPRPPEDRQY